MSVHQYRNGTWYVKWRGGETNRTKHFGSGELAEIEARAFDLQKKR